LLHVQAGIQHVYLAVGVLLDSVRSPLRWGWKLCIHLEARTFKIQ